MGRTRRPQPAELKRKLVAIRKSFDWTMDQMADELRGSGAEETIHSGYVADFETGKREPSLFALLAYSRVANVTINILVDDAKHLPKKLPAQSGE